MNAIELLRLLNDGEYTEFAYQIASLYSSYDYRNISDTISEFHKIIKEAE